MTGVRGPGSHLRMRRQNPGSRSKKKKWPGDSTSGRVVRAGYLDDAHPDFGPKVAFGLSIASLSDTRLFGQALRERNVGF